MPSYEIKLHIRHNPGVLQVLHDAGQDNTLKVGSRLSGCSWKRPWSPYSASEQR